MSGDPSTPPDRLGPPDPGGKETIERTVRDTGLLAPGGPVVVLFSGGRDSTCLLHVAVRIAGAAAVSALHVNYGLREDADEDERHCFELCARLGIELEIRRPRHPETGNLQAWARDQRYGAAAQLVLARDADVAAGHTATDQVETILYRLASSPSRRAVLGMRPREGRLVRPLLGFTREQTAAYCEVAGLTWREDATNDSDEFARNRIRAALVPAFEAVHPAAQQNLLALVEILREEAEVLDEFVDRALDGREQISLARLRELPPALRRLVVQRLADQAAGAGAIVAGAARRAEEIAALGELGTTALDIGHDVRAVAEYGMLRFEHGPARTSAPEPVRLAMPGSVVFGTYEVCAEVVTGAPAPGPGILDRGVLGSELLVRAWRPGDRMAPLGLQGTKSLQDLFTARRLPRARRAVVPVVEAADGQIAWVAGIATSERFKVTAATVQTVRLSAREPHQQGVRKHAPLIE
jgi:tRNA(Ile)-lysidine synthase